jgi:hypothetical protein
LGMAERSACFAAAVTLGQERRLSVEREVRLLRTRSTSVVTLGQPRR